ncbi:uncharacterized protein [Lepeophtheirus salmonis]|uniref:uncharacterized protein n=1 Tax=Lepeophtheirus salmonis TaxID=72036 RepID=UPI001AE67DE1|nr:zinc finger protein interacting with ribonucleoprotein K-like [Lepeophtheirus salmonis]
MEKTLYLLNVELAHSSSKIGIHSLNMMIAQRKQLLPFQKSKKRSLGRTKIFFSYLKCPYRREISMRIPLHFPIKIRTPSKDMFSKKSKTATKQLANRVQKPRNGTGPNVNSKIFLCSICGRTLTGLTAYNRHQVIHTGARPFSCNTCGKTFTQNQRLTVHKRTHTGERPYMCSLCGKTFTESCKLKRHATRVHKANKDGSTLVGFVPKNGDSSDKIPSPDPLIDKWNNMNKNPLQQPHAPPPSMIQDAINYCSIIKEEFADKSPDRHSIKIGD